MFDLKQKENVKSKMEHEPTDAKQIRLKERKGETKGPPVEGGG